MIDYIIMPHKFRTRLIDKNFEKNMIGRKNYINYITKTMDIIKEWQILCCFCNMNMDIITMHGDKYVWSSDISIDYIDKFACDFSNKIYELYKLIKGVNEDNVPHMDFYHDGKNYYEDDDADENVICHSLFLKSPEFKIIRLTMKRVKNIILHDDIILKLPDNTSFTCSSNPDEERININFKRLIPGRIMTAMNLINSAQYLINHIVYKC